MGTRVEEDVASKFVYRISSYQEWEELQNKGFTFGRSIDHDSGFIHLSTHSQVKATLQNFFQGRNDLYLLQIDSAKLGEGLIYEAVDDINKFPHFYGPSRSFSPLIKDFVNKFLFTEKKTFIKAYFFRAVVLDRGKIHEKFSTLSKYCFHFDS